jgi:hypothetical protein
VATVEGTAASVRASGATVVLLTLAAWQFLTLDTSPVLVVVALVFAQRISTVQPGRADGIGGAASSL